MRLCLCSSVYIHILDTTGCSVCILLLNCNFQHIAKSIKNQQIHAHTLHLIVFGRINVGPKKRNKLHPEQRRNGMAMPCNSRTKNNNNQTQHNEKKTKRLFDVWMQSKLVCVFFVQKVLFIYLLWQLAYSLELSKCNLQNEKCALFVSLIRRPSEKFSATVRLYTQDLLFQEAVAIKSQTTHTKYTIIVHDVKYSNTNAHPKIEHHATHANVRKRREKKININNNNSNSNPKRHHQFTNHKGHSIRFNT